MPVPYMALRYDLDAIRAWVYIISEFLGMGKLTRQKVKLFSYACLAVSAKRRGDNEESEKYYHLASKYATIDGLDVMKAIDLVYYTLNNRIK